MSFRKRRARARLLTLAIGGPLVAVGVFASGVLVARATMETDAATADRDGAIVLPGIAADPVQSFTANDMAPPTTGSRGSGTSPGMPLDAKSEFGCPGLLGGVISPGKIDPSQAGFEMKLLGEGFKLSSISLHAEGDCSKDGVLLAGTPALDTQWLHTGTGFQVYASQRTAKTPVANVLSDTSATLWRAGYTFLVNVNGFAGGGGVISVDKPASPAPVPVGPPAADPRATAVLREAIAQLAPGLGAECFYRQVVGGWESLASLGIGDPRSAIPAGFEAESVQVRSFAPPAADCSSPAPDDMGSFNAGWIVKGTDGNHRGYLGVSANAVPQGVESYPGHLDDYGASWSNGKYQFGVFAKSEKGVGVETIRAIVRALDPSFSEECLVTQRSLSSAELPGLGFHVPAAPAGYKLDSSNLLVTAVREGCPEPGTSPESMPNYMLSWVFAGNDGGIIQASAYRQDGRRAPERFGTISDYGLNWNDAAGTNFSVNGSTKGISPIPPRDVLIALAKGMDPTLDPSTLLKQDGGDYPKGMPVRMPEPAKR